MCVTIAMNMETSVQGRDRCTRVPEVEPKNGVSTVSSNPCTSSFFCGCVSWICLFKCSMRCQTVFMYQGLRFTIKCFRGPRFTARNPPWAEIDWTMKKPLAKNIKYNTQFARPVSSVCLWQCLIPSVNLNKQMVRFRFAGLPCLFIIITYTSASTATYIRTMCIRAGFVC